MLPYSPLLIVVSLIHPVPLQNPLLSNPSKVIRHLCTPIFAHVLIDRVGRGRLSYLCAIHVLQCMCTRILSYSKEADFAIFTFLEGITVCRVSYLPFKVFKRSPARQSIFSIRSSMRNEVFWRVIVRFPPDAIFFCFQEINFGPFYLYSLHRITAPSVCSAR